MTFDETMTKIKTALNKLITADKSKEELNEVAEIKKDLDTLGEAHNAAKKEVAEIKDLYIDAIKSQGSNSEPAGAGDNEKPVSLEQIAADLYGKGEKK